MSSLNRVTAMASVGFLLALAANAVGCGSAPDPAVKVGHVRIESATVKHWERAIDLGAPTTSSSANPRGGRHAQALDFLISGNWLIEEAARRRLAIPPSAVKRRVEERLGSLSNTPKVNKALAAKGRTITDAEFEARAALSGVKLREAIINRIPPATEAQIAAYYRRNRNSFRAERRVVDLIEQLKSRSIAVSVAHSLGSGRQFARHAIHEAVTRPTREEEEHNLNGHLVHAIFAAPIHTMAGPVSYFGSWVIFVVRRIEHGPLRLPEVANKIAARLLSARQQQALKAFAVRYRAEWRDRTSCQRGFIVPNCSEGREDPNAEADPLLGL